ncbi:MAG: UDP-N-acetylmuramoyl-L-alanyl-D-glutamate--2,6-diaminopimelate ligase [Enterobacterales bacterium]|nr:UDP-N-acetylmuramoyl-L-alanyl-D-glutamate--2,6-diaminopimelate ligase [Enterobacterales bacterium]
MANKPTLLSVLDQISSAQVEAGRENIPVGPLRLDSRQIQPGDTFVAVAGYSNDGRIYIPVAIQQQAALIFAEANRNEEFQQIFADIAQDKIIWIANLRDQVSRIAANYYADPSEQLTNIAVTGTNGKTSVSYLIAKTLQKLNFECYLMGTLGIGCCGNLRQSSNTTADAITLQAVLREALDCGAQFSSMEISSHGIDQNRALAIKLNTAIFTNLTRDHLDYHGNMENYGEAKRKLFLQSGLINAVLNMDDRFGRRLANDDAISATKWLVTTKLPTSGSNLNHWIWAEDVNYSLRGIHANIYTPWGSGKLDSPLIGQFNLSNLLLVIAALGSILKDLSPILSALKNVSAAVGRMQTLGNDKTPMAVVDYAHTPDALDKALTAIREHCVGTIWCVFGCGGDRDTGKRSLMAQVAEKLANRVIVTLDNPRTEDPDNVRKDIFSGFKNPDKIKYIESRKEAIEAALAAAQPNDVVLVAGKGHEDYQIVGKEKLYHSDRQICEDALARYAT